MENYLDTEIEGEDFKRPLSNLLGQYYSGALKKRELETKMIEHILTNYKMYGLFKYNKTDFIDYLCWLYPKLSSAIFKYKDSGASFDAYIHSIVRCASKEYEKKLATFYDTEKLCLDEADEHTALFDHEVLYDENKRGRALLMKRPRHALILFLKSYFYVSEEMISKTAAITGVDERHLKLMVNKLRQARRKKEVYLAKLRENIHLQYYKCLSFERRIINLRKSACESEELRSVLSEGRKRLENMRSRLKRMRMEATNKEIAKLLDLPKGTVDSSLAAIKRNYAEWCN
jgi:DNA-directed RNA polymerase specialized sigma24 family protein